MLHKLLEGVDRLLFTAPADLARCLKIEGSADNRSRRKHLCARIAHRAEPRTQEIADAARDEPGLLGDIDRAAGQRLRVFDKKVRQAFGLLVEALCRRGREGWTCGSPKQLLYGR